MSRQENEQKALDLVAGRKAEAPTAAPAKKGLGGLELMGILLWVLVLVGGGLGAAYYFVLAPK
jgi:hypothetical protein